MLINSEWVLLDADFFKMAATWLNNQASNNKHLKERYLQDEPRLSSFSSWPWAILESRIHGGLGAVLVTSFSPAWRVEIVDEIFLLNVEFPHDHLTVFSTSHHGTTITWYINASNSSCYKEGEIQPLGKTAYSLFSFS